MEHRNLIIAVVLTVGIFSVGVLTPAEYIDWLLYLIPLFVAAHALKPRSIPLLPLLVTLLIISDFFLSPSGGNLARALVNRAVAIFVLWSVSFILMKYKQELAERARQAALSAEVGATLVEKKDLRSLLQLCAEAIVKHLDAAFARIWTLNEKDNVLELQASAGMYTHINGAHSRVAVGKFKIGLIAQEKKPHLTNAVIGDPRISDPDWAKKEGMIAFAGHPLVVADKVVGVMAMFSKKRLHETALTALASIAHEIALGIERTRAQNALERSYQELEKRIEIRTKELSEAYEERKKMEEAMRHMAHHDALTDLPNRRLFVDIAAAELAQARRHKRKAAIMFLDLDRFKEINDVLGHAVGDALLKDVSERLKAHVRGSDTIARIGGDEFNIILPDIIHEEDGVFIARKIMESLRQPYVIAGHEFHATASIGITIYPDDGKELDTLLRYADIALYYAKEQGRNNYQFYDPAINIRSLERIRLESSLQQTLERGELVVFYQPLVEIKTGKIVNIEALIRWRHPEMGLLEPDKFLSAAEDTGFIVSIDKWVLRTACAQVKSWLDAGLPCTGISVNLSARHFQDPELVYKISELLKETGLPAKYLDVEITESMAMSNIERTIARLNELVTLGVHVSIDDFGTGYSSLNYLKRLPIQKLKIDKSFIRDIPTDADDRAIISAVTAMAHNMKIRVLAEGVETEEQMEFLRSTDCDEMQGYVFSRPLPSEGFEHFLKSNRRHLPVSKSIQG